jgi:hypothetical protein
LGRWAGPAGRCRAGRGQSPRPIFDNCRGGKKPAPAGPSPPGRPLL